MRIVAYLLLIGGFVWIAIFIWPGLRGSGFPFAPPEGYHTYKDTGEVVPKYRALQDFQDVYLIERRKRRELVPPFCMLVVGALLLDASKKRRETTRPNKASHATSEPAPGADSSAHEG